ncbi:MAG: hypothetical protein Kow0077_15360 [Anaerolineae bacterium]
MPLVFVSYARKDAEFVSRLVDDLKQNGIPLWLDRAALQGGAEWLTALENALEDATHLLVVVSTASNRSKFVKKEVLYALEEGKRVIPIRITSCKIPLIIRDLQYIDFVGVPYEEALRRLLAALPQSRQTAQPAEPAAPRHARFWEGLQAAARPRLRLHDHLKPPHRNTFTATAGVPGLKLRYALHRRDASVQLVIDTGDPARNRTLFDRLYAHRKTIEAAYGGPLVWDTKATRRSMIIHAPVLTADLRDEANWPATHTALVDAMSRLESALRPHLDALASAPPTA